ncbi:MAG: ATP-binding cassette domain-containing protein, partial [Spirochaetaceae bacterium]
MTKSRTQLPILEFDSVSKAYSSQTAGAVKEISFSIKTGELFCLIGPNGSGKSTVLKLAAGLLNPDT